jgi:hypothetical protein
LPLAAAEQSSNDCSFFTSLQPHEGHFLETQMTSSEKELGIALMIIGGVLIVIGIIGMILEHIN